MIINLIAILYIYSIFIYYVCNMNHRWRLNNIVPIRLLYVKMLHMCGNMFLYTNFDKLRNNNNNNKKKHRNRKLFYIKYVNSILFYLTNILNNYLQGIFSNNNDYDLIKRILG